MNCEEFGLAIIDDAEPRPEELDAHLSACPHCQALASAHRSAQRLRNLRFDLPARSKSVSAGRLWRRRLALRGTFAGMTLAVLAALVLTASREDASLHRVRTAAFGPSPVQAHELHAPARAQSLEDLVLEVNSYTQKDVSAHDETLEAFGELPNLLTPSANAVSATGRGPRIGAPR